MGYLPKWSAAHLLVASVIGEPPPHLDDCRSEPVRGSRFRLGEEALRLSVCGGEADLVADVGDVVTEIDSRDQE